MSTRMTLTERVQFVAEILGYEPLFVKPNIGGHDGYLMYIGWMLYFNDYSMGTFVEGQGFCEHIKYKEENTASTVSELLPEKGLIDGIHRNHSRH